MASDSAASGSAKPPDPAPLDGAASRPSPGYRASDSLASVSAGSRAAPAPVRAVNYHLPTLDGHTFVFVCGLQRSGTTMLYRYLGEHPSIAALEGTPRPANEGQHNQCVYPADELHSKAGRFAFARRRA